MYEVTFVFGHARTAPIQYILICYAKHNAHNTIHFIVNLSMSKVYNESGLKQHKICISHLFLWICIINYVPQYKSSQAQLYKSSYPVFDDLVSIRDTEWFNQHRLHKLTTYLSLIPTEEQSECMK